MYRHGGIGPILLELEVLDMISLPPPSTLVPSTLVPSSPEHSCPAIALVPCPGAPCSIASHMARGFVPLQLAVMLPFT